MNKSELKHTIRESMKRLMKENRVHCCRPNHTITQGCCEVHAQSLCYNKCGGVIYSGVSGNMRCKALDGTIIPVNPQEGTCGSERPSFRTPRYSKNREYNTTTSDIDYYVDDAEMEMRENLRKWFKDEDWVRIDTQGNIAGKCGTMKKGKKTQRCLPRKKAQSLTKKQRAATSRKKTRSKKQFVKNTKKAKVSLKKENIDKLKAIIKKTLEKEGGASGLKPIKKAISKIDKPKDFNLEKTLDKMGNVKLHKHGDYILTPLQEVEQALVGVIDEGLCAKGKAYVRRRKAAGEKHGAYLMGRAVKVCKGQMSGKKKKKKKNELKVPHRKSGYMGYSEPVDETNMTIDEVLNMNLIDENITEAKYKGKTVKLNKPMRGDVKKFKVYVNTGKKNADGSIKVKKVNFGHGGTSAKKRGEKTMKIRKSNPKARSAFRKRHNCDNPGPKTMARYWSCKAW